MIVILGILAAVVVFAVGGITNKGKQSACKIEVRTVNTALAGVLREELEQRLPDRDGRGGARRCSTELDAAKLISSRHRAHPTAATTGADVRRRRASTPPSCP